MPRGPQKLGGFTVAATPSEVDLHYIVIFFSLRNKMIYIFWYIAV